MGSDLGKKKSVIKSKGFSAVYFGSKVFAFDSQQCWG